MQKWKPKFNEIIFNYPAQFLRAKVGDKLIPTFEFNIKIIEIYCFVDNEGKIPRTPLGALRNQEAAGDENVGVIRFYVCYDDYAISK
jgi:hypothetical protein